MFASQQWVVTRVSNASSNTWIFLLKEVCSGFWCRLDRFMHLCFRLLESLFLCWRFLLLFVTCLAYYTVDSSSRMFGNCLLVAVWIGIKWSRLLLSFLLCWGVTYLLSGWWRNWCCRCLCKIRRTRILVWKFNSTSDFLCHRQEVWYDIEHCFKLSTRFSIRLHKYFQPKQLCQFTFRHSNPWTSIFFHELFISLVKLRFLEKFSNKKSGKILRIKLLLSGLWSHFKNCILLDLIWISLFNVARINNAEFKTMKAIAKYHWNTVKLDLLPIS